jgi:Tfp pilus assembly protein PilN
MRDHLVLVRLRKNFLKLSLVEQQARSLPISENRQAISELTGWIAEDVREIALKAEGDSRERALRQAVVSLLPHFNPGRDSLYICVPQEQAVVQELFFPQVAEANLDKVIEYEIERQLPFRREEVFYNFLPAGKRGDKIAVYLFAIPKAHLEGVLDVMASCGVQPSAVETTVTAMANYMLFCKGGFSAPAAILGGYEQNWEMIGVQSKPGGWRPGSELLFAHWLPEASRGQGLEQELLHDCLTRSVELYGWGDVDHLFSSFNGDAPTIKDLVGMGNERLNGGKKISHPYIVPALGAALRGVREASFTMNLLGGDPAEEASWKTFSGLNLLLTALLMIALFSWGASYAIKDELRLRRLQSENQRIEPAVEALRREESEVERLRKELSVLVDVEQRKGEALRVLDELTKVVPSNTFLSNFRYRGTAIELQGSAENASALIPLLERSPVFENVGFTAPSNRGRDNRETFSLRADLAKSKQKAAQP